MKEKRGVGSAVECGNTDGPVGRKGRRVVVSVESGRTRGPTPSDAVDYGAVEFPGQFVVETKKGPIRYADKTTFNLDQLARSYAAATRAYVAHTNRGAIFEGLSGREFAWAVAHGSHLESAVGMIAKELRRTLRNHMLWPWLRHFPGLAGAHVAMLLGRIKEPRKFAFDPMHPTAPRRSVRKLWCYIGTSVVDGVLPRPRKGVQGNWNQAARQCLLQPGGIAEQIVRLRVPKYRDIYDRAKARLMMREGLVERCREIECGTGEASMGAAVDTRCVSEVNFGRRAHAKMKRPARAIVAGSEKGHAVGRASDGEGAVELPTGPEWITGGPLPLWRIDKIARTIAAKAFVADLWREWCRLLDARS